MNYLHLFYYAGDYYSHIYRQYRFVKTYLQPMVRGFCDVLKYQLNSLEERKVYRYYPLLTVCALAENYTLLKGRGLSAIERKRITLMSAMATLCDDLIDEGGWTEQQLLDLLDSRHPYGQLPVKAKLIIAMNEEFKKLDINPAYWVQLRKAFHGQAESIRQHDSGLSLDETIHIAREKNGNYCLAVAALIDENWSQLEHDIIYQHGMMGQMTNDIYDTYKDTHEGIHTMVKKVWNVRHLRDIFMSEVERIQTLILQLDVSIAGKKRIIRRYACMDAFTMVGIDTLDEVEHLYGQPVDWKSVPRRQLVPDMAKYKSRKRYFKYVVWLSNLPFRAKRKTERGKKTKLQQHK
ncbi:MAG TPA: class 1 isoprenoid biosynthesis enzyme [Chitinophagaceae bacterium]